jgi:hypothetical protein
MSRRLALLTVMTSAFLLVSSVHADLHVVESVSGNIWDFQPDRLLYLDASNSLRIRDKATGLEATVMDDSSKVPQYGYLTPTGAVFMEQSGSVLTSNIYDWTSGGLVDLGTPNSARSLKVSGNYAIWNRSLRPGNYATPLMLRDLTSGTNTVVHHDSGNTMNDVTAGGEVVYWTSDGFSGSGDTTYDYNIFRYRDGVTTRLTNDTDVANVYPLADGSRVVYRSGQLLGSDWEIRMHSDLGVQTLAKGRTEEPSPGRDYAVSGEWVAYTNLGPSGNLQIWMLSPSGEARVVTAPETSSRISTLAPNGELAFVNNSRLYLQLSDLPAFDIGSSSCRSLWRDGQWFVIDGGTLSEVSAPQVVPLPGAALLGALGLVTAGFRLRRRH